MSNAGAMRLHDLYYAISQARRGSRLAISFKDVALRSEDQSLLRQLLAYCAPSGRAVVIEGERRDQLEALARTGVIRNDAQPFVFTILGGIEIYPILDKAASTGLITRIVNVMLSAVTK